MTTNWRNKQVVIIGAARQGLALARYLARHGARVTVNDRRPASELVEEMALLAKFDLTWAVGEHDPQMIAQAQALFVSGGVPLENPLVLAARQQGIPVSNDTQVFMQAAPCKSIGITGSAGKTTTTTLVGKIAQIGSSGKYGRVWIGGNIGDPLINYVDEMQASDLAILEISSFQSELMTTSPDIAAILNITPNHLDRHKTMENYIAAKANVLAGQSESGIAILGRDDPGSWALLPRVRGRLLSFGFGPLPAGMDGAYVLIGQFFIREGQQFIPLPVAE
ncbi:MAG: Mur ligase family protein, partial [Anaerolineales bacterium]|nr:Mur ligase family protein [Anaerolineales bacterium]